MLCYMIARYTDYTGDHPSTNPGSRLEKLASTMLARGQEIGGASPFTTRCRRKKPSEGRLKATVKFESCDDAGASCQGASCFNAIILRSALSAGVQCRTCGRLHLHASSGRALYVANYLCSSCAPRFYLTRPILTL